MDRTPEYPFIVEVPGPAYWIKFAKGHPWVTLRDLAQHGNADLLAALIKKAMGEPPKPPGGPGEGNGDSPLWWEPPFKKGDLVIHTLFPDLGTMMIVEIFLRMLPESKKLIWVATAVYRVADGTGYQELTDFAANFRRAEGE